MTRSVERLARDLVGLERRLRFVETQPQLGHTSISDGGVNVYTPVPREPDAPLPGGVGTDQGAREFEESLRLVWGTLPDGTHGQLPVNAPPPPEPSVPLLAEHPRGAMVRWDGHNSDGTDIQPLDWSRLEIHASVGNEFTPQPSTLRGTIETPQGGTLLIAAGLDYDPVVDNVVTVRFVARNTSGIASPPSAPATIAVGKVENFDLADFSVTVRKFVSLRHFLY